VTRTFSAVARIGLGAVLGLAFAAAAAASSAANVEVLLDEAMIFRLPPRVSTIVIGNPAIADVTIQHSGIAIVTGKSYGSTNMIMLDAAGDSLVEQKLVVKPRNDEIVTVQNGVDRESYVCTPLCERTAKLGDGTKSFDAVTGQASAHTSFANGSAASQAK